MSKFKAIVEIVKGQRVIRFLITGGSAAIVEYAMFLVLFFYVGNEWIIVANSISFLLGLTVSFLMNKLWVFRSGNSYGAEFTKYFTLAIVNLALSGLMISIVTNQLVLDAFQAKVIVMIVIACWNYLVFSKFIFGNKQ